MIVGNILAFIGSLLMIYSGTILNKKKILLVEIIEMIILALGNIVVAGIHGALVNLLNMTIDILCFKGKLNFKSKSVLTVGMLLLQFNIKEVSILGTLIIIAALTNLWLMDTKNVAFYKGLCIFAMVTWLMYDISLSLYTAVIFDVITIGVNIVSIIRIKQTRRRKVKKSMQEILNERMNRTIDNYLESQA